MRQCAVSYCGYKVQLIRESCRYLRRSYKNVRVLLLLHNNVHQTGLHTSRLTPQRNASNINDLLIIIEKIFVVITLNCVYTYSYVLGT